MDELSHPGKNGTAFQINWLVEMLANLSKESSFSSFEARFVAFKSVFFCGKMVITFRNLQVAGHRLQVIVSPIQKVSSTFLKANLRPKNFCLGLIRPKVSF